jgi:iron complex outermembrane receptor protein
MFSKKFLSGAALTALTISAGGVAHAQSTASQIQEEEEVIVVQGVRRSVDGAIVAESAPKARSTVTEEYIETQSPGQTILNTINLIPGVSFTNNDSFGSSGGSLRLRGFDGPRISLTFDGVPLNDTGNYAIFSNQQLDPELINRATVNVGTTDVDSPTASATGGTVNYVTRTPDEESAILLAPSLGTEDYRRLFTMVETGEFGPWGTRSFASFSYQTYDQFVGPGDLEKIQVNARLYQPLEGSDFMSLSFHFNRNRNNFYRQGSFAEWAFSGGDNWSNLSSCTRAPATPGVADNDGASPAGAGAFFSANDNPANPSSCTNYYGLRINPSNTGNIRGQSRFSLTDALTFTFDPAVQYVLANGGGTAVVSETDNRLRAGTGLGVDLNGDGDTLDSVRLYTPSNTNTIRYTVTSSLIWDIAEAHRMIFGYTWETGRHRQTGEYGFLDANGDPMSIWGGKDGVGADPILTQAGDVFQRRNRLSIAALSQPSIRYIGDFFNDSFTVDLGLRAPTFTRDLDQRCYVTPGSSGDPVCASGTFVPTGVAPFKASVEYDDILPSVGLSFRPGEGHQVFLSYAAGLSAPRTDDLYNGLSPVFDPPPPGGPTINQLELVEPETSQAYDLGYRYNGAALIFSAGVWYNQFQNRIVRVFDPDQGINISRNVGDVDLWGADVAVGWQVTNALSLYGSAAYVDSELADNLQITGGTVALTRGKQLVETPDWTFSGRAEYEIGDWVFGLQGKYTGDRWMTDVNDLRAPGYTVVDLDVRWNILDNTSLQLNVNNLFDELYVGSFGSQVATTGPGAGTTRYNIGAPRTALVTLRTEF